MSCLAALVVTYGAQGIVMCASSDTWDSSARGPFQGMVHYGGEERAEDRLSERLLQEGVT